MLVVVYSCQNTTLLEITCRGSKSLVIPYLFFLKVIIIIVRAIKIILKIFNIRFLIYEPRLVISNNLTF